MISPAQLQLLNIARRQVAQASGGTFDEAQWRLTLRNVGQAQPGPDGRVSSKSLDQPGFEAVMAFLEGLGFRDRTGPPDYWRSRHARRAGLASFAQVQLIHRLYRHYADAARQAGQQPYELGALCRRASAGYHDDPARLTPALAAKLVQALRDVTAHVAGRRPTRPTHGDAA